MNPYCDVLPQENEKNSRPFRFSTVSHLFLLQNDLLLEHLHSVVLFRFFVSGQQNLENKRFTFTQEVTRTVRKIPTPSRINSTHFPKTPLADDPQVVKVAGLYPVRHAERKELIRN